MGRTEHLMTDSEHHDFDAAEQRASPARRRLARLAVLVDEFVASAGA